VLQELGLIAAIRKEAKDLQKTAGVKTMVMISENLGRFDPVVETAIYRVVQESLHNVAKHAKARNVTIDLQRRGETLRLVVADDGTGMRKVTNSMRPSFGMAGMQERISTLGGQMKVESHKGGGTRISITVPMSSRPEKPDKGHRVRTGRALADTGS